MLSRIAQVLVLGCVFGFPESAGLAQSEQGDLPTSESLTSVSPNSDSVTKAAKATLGVGSDFAFDLYRQLASSGNEGNFFFSPYSISQALSMAAEAARGKTAQEMGTVLHIPKESKRTGDDAESSPWNMSQIHSAYSRLNKRLSAAQDNPNYDNARSRLKGLEKKYATLDAKVKKMLGASFGSFRPATKSQRAVLDRLTNQRNQIGREMAKLELRLAPCEVRVANAIWGAKTFAFNQSYVRTISKHYDTSGVFTVDFRDNFESARQRINSWCSEQTNNRIQEILPSLSPDQSRMLRVALTNAVYFKADWDTKFDAGKTEVQAFTRSDGSKVKTSIMNGPDFSVRYAAFNADGTLFPTPEEIKLNQSTGLYPDADGFAMVELPYRGNEVSMLVIAPNHHSGLKAIEENLNAENLSRWIQQMRPQTANIFLPKFKYESNFDLKEALEKMGMVEAFRPSADFSGLTAGSSEPVYLGMVQHKALIEVNETSTEAAAATFVGGVFGGPPKVPFVPDFRADRPFMYVIRDIESGSILFVGRMTAP